MKYGNRQIFWSIDEVKQLVKLKQNGHTYKEIGVILNSQFHTLRTTRGCQSKYESLNKQSFNIDIDKIIVKFVRTYPANLQLSFELAAKELNNTFGDKLIKPYTKNMVSGRYYSYIRINYNVISVGSVTDGFTINIKNRKKQVKAQPKLTPVMYLLKEILKLSDKDRLLLTQLLNST